VEIKNIFTPFKHNFKQALSLFIKSKGQILAREKKNERKTHAHGHMHIFFFLNNVKELIEM
jgi:hypothetical protein